MFKNTFLSAAIIVVAIGISSSTSAMAVSIQLPDEPSDPIPSTEPETPVIDVTIPGDNSDDSSDSASGRTGSHGCGAEIARFAHIHIDAAYLTSINGSEPVRLVDVCSPMSLMDDVEPALDRYGNVTGLHEVIARNPVLAATLSAKRYDAADVVAVVPGKGATYLMVHAN